MSSAILRSLSYLVAVSALLLGFARAQGGACSTGAFCPTGQGCLTVVTYNNQYFGPPPNPGGGSGVVLNLPQFNPSLGTLLKAEYSGVTTLVSARLTVHNLDPVQGCTMTGYVFRFTWSLHEPSGGEMFLPTMPVDDESSPLPHFLGPNGSGNDTFDSGELVGTQVPHATANFCRDSTSSGGGLAPFIGTGNLLFTPISILQEAVTSTCSNLGTSFFSIARVVVSITYTYCAPSPAANDDMASTCAGTSVTLNVLANDPGAQGGQINCVSLVVVAPPASGTVAVLPCPPGNNQPCLGSCFRYTPNAGFSGADSFTYHFANLNGCVSNPATVHIVVGSSITANDDLGLVTGSPPYQPITIHLYANDLPQPLPPGMSGTLLTAQCPPLSGSIVSFNSLNGTLVYQPFSSFSGIETLCYQICDPSSPCCSTAHVSISHAPPSGSYCWGDGSGTACPCGNPGASGEGCANSLGFGAKLRVVGTASISADTLVLMCAQMPNSSCLYFQGTLEQNGGAGSVFGDGLRCAGGSTIRLGSKTNVNGASSYPGTGDTPISVRGGCTVGVFRTYQCWYRNAATFCTSSTFNLSNGIHVTWGS